MEEKTVLYTPGLRPLLPLGGRLNAEILYEKQLISLAKYGTIGADPSFPI